MVVLKFYTVNESQRKKIPFPKHAILIILNELAERFSYHGMKAVLTLYLSNILNYNEDKSTIIFHIFFFACYFTPIFGATLADSWIGKYYTIFYLSILYALGNVALALGAIAPLNLPQVPMTILGLLLISIGMGGIKPCVSAFGGDQFKLPEQEKQLTAFFSIFYFFINAGAFLSLIISPILRKNVKCFQADTCFPLSFGVPAALMIISIVLLVCGRRQYTYKEPGGNMIKEIFKCSGHAIKQKLKSDEGVIQEHWLDYARNKYDWEMIESVKKLLRILVLFIPLPFFWALCDQQGSRWTFQATRMNGDFYGINIKPDQMQMLNPLLMLPLIIIFYKIIYPVSRKCNIPCYTNLQKMTIGGVFAGLAFILAGYLQQNLEKTYPVKLNQNSSHVTFISNVPCPINITLSKDLNSQMEPYGEAVFASNVTAKIKYESTLTMKEGHNSICTNSSSTFEFQTEPAKVQTFFVQFENNTISVKSAHFYGQLEKNGEGAPLIRFAFLNLAPSNENEEVYLKIRRENGAYAKVWRRTVNGPNALKPITYDEFESIAVPDLDTQLYKTEPYLHTLELHYKYHNQSQPNLKSTSGKPKTVIEAIGKFYPKQGGNFLYVISKSPQNNKVELREYVVTQPNSIHMLWLLPQYFLMTIGEVMFTISGCEFAFVEAPIPMKSLFQAVWYMNVAIGNILVVVITELRINNEQSQEFFMYSILMFIAISIFGTLAFNYDKTSKLECEDNNEEIRPRRSLRASLASISQQQITLKNEDDNDGQVSVNVSK